MNPTVAFVARHNGRLSRPCPDCVAALKSAGVKEIWYTYEPNEWRHEKIA